MHYAEILKGVKMLLFKMKLFDIFLIFAQSIDRRYTLEPAVLTSTHNLCFTQK